MKPIIKDVLTKHRAKILLEKIMDLVAEELDPPATSPVYGLGRPDPIAFAPKPPEVETVELTDEQRELCKQSYTSFSGVDIKMEIDDEQVAEGQAINWNYLIDTGNPTTHKVDGQLTVALFIGTYAKLAEWSLSGMVHQIKLTGVNEFGQMMRIEFSDVKFLNLSSGIAIDDLFCDATINFTAKDMEYVEVK